jgi:hypothetical protein
MCCKLTSKAVLSFPVALQPSLVTPELGLIFNFQLFKRYNQAINLDFPK